MQRLRDTTTPTKISRGAFSGPPTPLKNIPKRDGLPCPKGRAQCAAASLTKRLDAGHVAK